VPTRFKKASRRLSAISRAIELAYVAGQNPLDYGRTRIAKNRTWAAERGVSTSSSTCLVTAHNASHQQPWKGPDQGNR